ncbi:MAG: sporulation integral membrane protein YtvI [Oscillospiraceae bacterium]|nr:sporulation integral membrane protein YtvI [Oscillospiraceae bacterium]
MGIVFGTAFLLIIIKYVLPWTAPFILAFLAAMIIEPGVRTVSDRLRLRRWIVSGIMTVSLFALTAAICKAVILNVSRGVSDLLRELPETLDGISGSLGWLNSRIENYISSAPDGIREYLDGAAEHIARSARELPGELSGTALKYLTRIASHMPKILLFTVTYAVGTFFISSRFAEVKGFILRQIPEKHRDKITVIKNGILSTLLKWLKAQLMLMSITFLELTAGFLLLRIPHHLLMALITSLIDALPVLGVGTVLLPWSLVQLITGNPTLALGLAVLYAAVTMIRSLLEPKLISAQLGLNPVAALIAIYAGFSCIGVAGMILFPAGLMILKQMNDEGIIKLWK